MLEKSKTGNSLKKIFRKTALLSGCLTISLLASISSATAKDSPPEPIEITVLSVNDFEGAIDGNTIAFTGTVEKERASAGEESTVFISSGDLINGTTTAAGKKLNHKYTIDTMNALDLRLNAVGNHELDGNVNNYINKIIPASNFPHISANVWKQKVKAFASYEIVNVRGVDIAFIGATTKNTTKLNPLIFLQGITFTDPVNEVNNTVAALNKLPNPPDVMIAVYHEGAVQPGNVFTNLLYSLTGGPSTQIVNGTSPEVDGIFTAHTHGTYTWNEAVPGNPGKTRPIVQGGVNGNYLTKIELVIDPSTKEVSLATGSLVPRITTPNSEITAQYPRAAKVKTIVEAATAN